MDPDGKIHYCTFPRAKNCTLKKIVLGLFGLVGREKIDDIMKTTNIYIFLLGTFHQTCGPHNAEDDSYAGKHLPNPAALPLLATSFAGEGSILRQKKQTCLKGNQSGIIKLCKHFGGYP